MESATLKRLSEKVNGPIRSETPLDIARNPFAVRKEKTIINRQCVLRKFNEPTTYFQPILVEEHEKKKKRKQIKLYAASNAHFEFWVQTRGF